MNFLLHFYPGDKFVLLSANVLLQATVVILAAWLPARIFFRRNAAIRHNIWLSALVLVLISPVIACVTEAAGLRIITIYMPAASQPESPTASSESTLASPPDIAEQGPLHFLNQPSSVIVSNFGAERRTMPFPPMLRPAFGKHSRQPSSIDSVQSPYRQWRSGVWE